MSTIQLAGLILNICISAFWLAGIVSAICTIKPQKFSKLPVASVIIAARNEENYIQRCLQSVFSLDYPKSLLEVIVVDDHSTDQTKSIAEKISMNYSGLVKVFSAPDVPENTSPKKNALVYAIAHSNGEILFFTDADSEVPKQWIRSMLSFYDEKTGAVAGISLPEKNNSRLYYLERILINYTSLSAIGWKSPASVCGQNFSYPRKAFTDAGGMCHRDVISGDDDLLAQQISGSGWKVKFCLSPSSIVKDLREITFSRELQSTVRHQSTARFYPLHWRIMYSFFILTSYFLITAGCLSFINISWAFTFLSCLISKFMMDAVGVFWMRKKLCFRLSLPEFLFMETMLPVYVCMRTLLLLFPQFSWQNRRYRLFLTKKYKPVTR